MGGWENFKLSELGKVIGGSTPSTKREEYYGGNIAWITPKDLSGYQYRFISKGSRNITEEGLYSCSLKMLPKNSILFTSRAPIGYVAIAENDLCTNQGFKSIIPNENVDYMFMYYLIKYNKEIIEAMGSGTTFKEVSGTVMKNVCVKIPIDKKEQQKISKILSSLDDKIEINRKINENLEEQAKEIFLENFVRNEKNYTNWEKVSLIDIANYLNGLAMQKYRPKENEESLPVLKIKELRQGVTDKSSELCSCNIDSNYIINNGDIIFSWSGSLLVDIWCGGTCGLNQHLFKVTSDKYEKWFYYLWTKYHLDEFILIAKDKATTMGHIKRENLKNAQVLIPSDEEYKKLTLILKPMIDLIIDIKIQIQKLSSIRDELLPKLMTGEIDVSKIDI